MPRAVLFANPSAQSGQAAPLIEEARGLLERVGLPHEFVPTAPAGGTVERVRQAIDEGGARTVIYMGGDGTFAEVAKGILRSAHAGEVALGLLPMGTANDQGKSFGLEAGPEALGDNVRVIARGATALLDAGRILRLDEADRVTHEDLFFDSASIGFGAAVLRTRNADRRAVGEVPLLRELYRDQLVYAGALVKHLLESYVTQAKFELELVVDGEKRTFPSVLDVIVKNTPVFGGEWVLDPEARSDDGLLEVVPIVGRRDFTSKLLSTLRHLPFGEKDLAELGLEHSRPVRGATFLLTVFQPGASEPPAVQIDGEEFPAGDRFRVEAVPRCLRVIVPGGARASGGPSER